MPLYKQQQGCSNQPALVFLHGFLGSCHDWSDTIDRLKDRFHCVAIDLPGHGASVTTASSRSDGFNQCHHLINDVLNELNIKQFTLIGYSLGGRIALDYARTQNDTRLQALVLESSHIGLIDPQIKEQRFMDDHGWAKKFATQGILDTLSEWYDQGIFSDLSDRKKEFVISKRANNYGVPLANMLLSTSLGKQQSALSYLENTALTIHYCIGEKDKKFKKIAKQLLELKNINVTEFEKVGHNIHQQDASQFSQFLLNTLK
ncbi:2-succinyl-6-hydroxy-2,4-cyclohexadiene-1-carboxylate synthase [Psychromonas sp. psych-6C06]|uniref:2-succinyl-6-hydroxy-2, 4-cyclohexadiene-1-carboxylate synthase n=1 Tax=Psychromonas sp. psych-6C06 TaxID=2058089 RepID=UPI000C3421C9|nr:2-succinyl-6-hydroxy-2,4-cyclohexadiene-1-carboxylate synthase [Psychromonas sp. psych-6C06]PKF61652.1 2-succinyl-6-hydroxy-2,4-cyclohexadiene-1-carboxylate synthase [Psychromonas sp. psych-6C06]